MIVFCKSRMWMPLRAVKMYGFIFGFQRLVWCPKCTPASSSWRMVMPCAGCMACCMPAAGGDSVGAVVWTFSDIVFLLHLRRAHGRPQGGTLPGSGGVRSGCCGLQEQQTPRRTFPGGGGFSSKNGVHS